MRRVIRIGWSEPVGDTSTLDGWYSLAYKKKGVVRPEDVVFRYYLCISSYNFITA